MMLGELIKALEDFPRQEQLVARGFADPHSYRGSYCDVAFEPRENVMVRGLLASAREALGSTYGGCKGGDFVMHEHVDVYLAFEGCTGEELGATLLDYMLGRVQ